MSEFERTQLAGCGGLYRARGRGRGREWDSLLGTESDSVLRLVSPPSDHDLAEAKSQIPNRLCHLAPVSGQFLITISNWWLRYMEILLIILVLACNKHNRFVMNLIVCLYLFLDLEIIKSSLNYYHFLVFFYKHYVIFLFCVLFNGLRCLILNEL